MAQLTQYIHLACDRLGFHPGHFVHVARTVPYFLRTMRTYRDMNTGEEFPLRVRRLFPQLNDRDAPAGDYDSHYFYQDLWAARKIYALRPTVHFDIGSRLDGFISHLLVFTSVTLIDIRPLEPFVDGLHFIQDDATDLRRFENDSIASLSSLHAIEHFGLGRYGDPVDPGAWKRAFAALSRVLAPGGRLYLSLPIGRERLEFNAHRIFSPRTVLRHFPQLRLLSFSAVDDKGIYHAIAAPDDYVTSSYGCGMFEFTKP